MYVEEDVELIKDYAIERGTKDMNHANDDDSVCAEDIPDEASIGVVEHLYRKARFSIWWLMLGFYKGI